MPTAEPPTAEPPTAVPPTAVPTAEPPTVEPPTAEPPTVEPPTAVPPTNTPVPPTKVPPTGVPVPPPVPTSSSNTTSNASGAEIQLQLKASNQTAKVGETVSFTITVINSGGSNLTNVLLNSTQLNITNVAIFGGNLGHGVTAVIEGTYKIQESDLPGPLQVTATVNSAQVGPVSTSVSITIDGHVTAPDIDPTYIAQTVSWQPIRACERKCVRWQLYQTNQNGHWEISRLGDTGEQSIASTPVSNPADLKIDNIAPSRSPNGDWITYSSNRDGNWEIYLARSDGSSPQRITENVQANDLNPVWGPNNFVVYQSNRDGDWNLYLFDTATGTETRLTDSTADDINPTWSPDGSKVAFQTNRDGRWQIYSVQVETGEVKHLSNGDRNDYEPLYSPDGNNIAFRSVLDGKTNSNVFVMGAQGGKIIPVTNFEGNSSHPTWSANSQLLAYQSDKDGDSDIYTYDLSSGETLQLTNNKVNDYAPSFLCDGSKLLYNSDGGGKANIYQIDALAPDNSPQQLTTDGDNLYAEDGGLSQLSSGANSGGTTLAGYPVIALAAGAIEPAYPRLTAWSAINACETTCPSWSVYTGKIDNNWDIFRQDSPTAQPVNISRLSEGNSNISPDNVMPSVSPNGKWVVFASNRDKYWELYISSTDGTVFPRRLTYSKGLERNPIWSPGGQSIVYESNRDGNWELYLADISSGKEQRLTFNNADDTHARWSPDASRIIFQSNRSGRSQIYQLDLQTDLVTTLSDGKTDDSEPVYAPDGLYIAFRSVHADNPNGLITILATDGMFALVVSNSAQDASNPVWSSKGMLLAYQVSENGSQAIYGYDASAGATRKLIASELKAYAPTWGCDGSTLVVNVGTGDTSNIYVLDKLLPQSSPINTT
ncbi:MAG: hypothetical protein ABI970_13040, partial [Chloroflexota bacterium]